MKKQSKKITKVNQKNRPMDYEVKVAGELLPFLRDTLTHHSRNSVKSILTRGQVSVDGQVVTKHNHVLKVGQHVTIQDNQTAIKEHALIGVQVIYEDDVILVIEKESGILSIANNNRYEVTAHSQLMNYVKQDNPNNRVYIVHRLDRDTSGVMLFAKNEQVKHLLQDTWKETVEERMYTALVEGSVTKESGTITSWLTESKAFKMHFHSSDKYGGKKAITHYKKIRGTKEFSLLEVRLDTGRKNQIRVHMEELGHPVVGDKKYGARTNPIKRLGLHATTLAFTHPTTGKQMEFKSKVPPKFIKALKN
ncbi:RNA pseudouridine synthase [Vagococcus penaei]|uniref:Pseudouridine synthase n=1 Tax=Vagococcus penaei TaxID=633807 RepID=A0A1Q2D4R5_9ENTE|nr:RluA family pseudouridine synthase [Vagococcus penaei]AQP53396.1 RNA pseudouridine synthase [Vagococcus penaei]RST99718.1 RNA pseudouridine synthase [Vagococcus penaei]